MNDIHSYRFRNPHFFATIIAIVALSLLGSCAKDTSMDIAGDQFLRGITNGDTALLRTVSSRKLLASIATEGWPIDLTATRTVQMKTTWVLNGKTLEGDTVAYINYTLTSSASGKPASANCKLRLVKESGNWKVEDLLPGQ